MQCFQCQHENSATARFCEECGTELVRACPGCGQAVSPQARFCSACGQRLGAAPLRLVEGLVRVQALGPVPVKGLVEPVEVFELVGVSAIRRRLQAVIARGLTRFVGRQTELEVIRQALERAGAGHGQVVALLGEAGVGKSRLVYEVVHSHHTQGWLVLESASISYGKATPYFPVIDLVYALRLLGEIAAYRDPPEVASAEAHYRQALALAEELGMRPLVAHCHLGLGTLYAKLGQREQARAELTAAIELYRATDMTFWLPQAEAALAQAGGLGWPESGTS